jgi:superoxide oxidase
MSNESVRFQEHPVARQPELLEPAGPSFDTVTITIHWVSLLLVLAIVGTGLMYGQIEHRPWAPPLLWVHRSLGVILWAITVARLSWRLKGARIPELPTFMTPLHRFAARWSERGLYIILLTQPVTGLAQTLSRGRPFELLVWTVPPILSRNLDLAVLFHAIHSLGAWCLIGLVSLHASAALFHHFIRRDDVLETMAPILRRKRELEPAATSLDVHSMS